MNLIDNFTDKLLAIIISIFEAFYRSFIEPFTDLSSLKDLVFGKNNEGESIWATFSEKDISLGLSPIYNTMLILAFILMVAFIVLFGMRLSSSTINPAKRIEAMQMASSLVLVGIGINYLPALYDILFAINASLIELFASNYDSTLDELEKAQAFETDGSATDTIGRIAISLVLIGLAIWANFYYMMRRITLILLMGLGPIFLVAWLHPKFKALTVNWFRELNSTIFVQSIHALTYWLIGIVSGSADGLIPMLIVYVVFIPVTIAIRKLFMMGGDMQDSVSKAGSAFGLASLGAMAGAVKGAIDGKDMKQLTNSAIETFKNRGGIKGFTGNGQVSGDPSLNGDLVASEGAAAGSIEGTDKKTSDMFKAGEALANLGRGTFGAMGALAGAGLGPGGTLMGTGIGYGIGGVGGGVIGRVGKAGLDSLKDRFESGMNAVDALSKTSEEDDPQLEHAATALANKEMTNWQKSKGETLRANLQEQFPDATADEIEQKAQAVEQQVHDGFKAKAKQQLSQAQDYGLSHVDGDSLKKQAPIMMANQWAKENREKFDEDYAQAFPQEEGESDEAFETRRAEAFNNKKKQMRLHFEDAAGKVVEQEISGQPNNHVSKSNFINRMADALKGVDGVTNPEGLAVVGADAGEQVTLFDKKGNFNAKNAATNFAITNTAKDKADFIQKETALGRPQVEAEKLWQDNHQQPTFSKYQQQFNEANVNEGMPSPSLPVNRSALTPTKLEKFNAFREGSGLTFTNMGSNLAKPLTTTYNGLKQVGTNYMIARAEEAIVPIAAISAVGRTAQGAIDSFKQSGIEEHGSAIDAQQAFTNKVGYAAGMVFGQSGYQRAKRLGMKISPYAQEAQEESYTASDVMQMAKTYTDDKGNTQVTPGAIRQVITPNESYIEVTTKGDEIKRVSQIAAGHSGLREGDVVYQDLGVQNGMLVPVSANGGNGASTYRMDVGGAKMPSDVMITQNPNSLLRQPQITNSAKPIDPSQIGSVSVPTDDTATYSPREVKQMALSVPTGNGEIQTAPGAIRHVVTADSSYVEVRNANGQMQRVTTRGQGNPNLQSGQVLYQDLDVNSNGQYIPVPAGLKENAQATTYTINSGGMRQATNATIAQSPNDLVSAATLTKKVTTTTPVKRKEAPMFNQKVDAGQFLIDDLQAEGMQNVQIVVEQDRRYVTAQNQNGDTFRVSPVFTGDTRVPTNEVRRIPVSVEKGQLKPVHTETPHVAKAVVERYENGQVAVVEDTYSTLNGLDNLMVSDLMQSRNYRQAQRSVEKRQAASQFRRKQGFLS